MKTKNDSNGFTYLNVPKVLGSRFRRFDRRLLQQQAEDLFKRIQLRQDVTWPGAEEAGQTWPVGAFDPGI